MEQIIVVEAQKGVWIEERFLRQAHLGERLQVVVEEGEIRILPTTAETTRLPFGATADEAQTVLQEARAEAIALYGGQAPPADQPYFGGVTWQAYQALSDKQRQTLWDKVYAEFDVANEDVEERDVRPDALVAG